MEREYQRRGQVRLPGSCVVMFGRILLGRMSWFRMGWLVRVLSVDMWVDR